MGNEHVAIAANKYVFAVIVFLASTITSAAISYCFSKRQAWIERREQVFEEVSTLIETGHAILDSIDDSFTAQEDPSKRIELWNKYEAIQAEYLGSRSRRLFLLDKYFGSEIAGGIEMILSDFDKGTYNKTASEEVGETGRGYVTYSEIWEGLGPDSLRSGYGYKWKMMSLCGMDVKPYLKKIKKEYPPES
ncbi:MAG TPA: hypothetical protein PKC67_06395 [Kiritimatiellia bacterium]|nr:hypothetical protein [Kiritimatiellia bacterium]HMP33964.1 hypothetical protein [Kiritimatiellia bacterium]